LDRSGIAGVFYLESIAIGQCAAIAFGTWWRRHIPPHPHNRNATAAETHQTALQKANISIPRR
jgi:hypothetical protein